MGATSISLLPFRLLRCCLELVHFVIQDHYFFLKSSILLHHAFSSCLQLCKFIHLIYEFLIKFFNVCCHNLLILVRILNNLLKLRVLVLECLE